MIDDYLIQLIVQFVTKSKNVGDPREEMRSSLSLSLSLSPQEKIVPNIHIGITMD